MWLIIIIIAIFPVEKSIGSGLGIDRGAKENVRVIKVIQKKTIESGIGIR